MLPLSPAFSVLPVEHAGALALFTACSKMEMAEKNVISCLFNNFTGDVCRASLCCGAAGSQEQGCLLAGGRRKACTTPQTSLHPQHWETCRHPSGTLPQDRVGRSPAARGASPAPAPDPAAPRAFPVPAGGLAGCSRGFAPSRPPSPLVPSPSWVPPWGWMAAGMKAQAVGQKGQSAGGGREILYLRGKRRKTRCRPRVQPTSPCSLHQEVLQGLAPCLQQGKTGLGICRCPNWCLSQNTSPQLPLHLLYYPIHVPSDALLKHLSTIMARVSLVTP